MYLNLPDFCKCYIRAFVLTVFFFRRLSFYNRKNKSQLRDGNYVMSCKLLGTHYHTKGCEVVISLGIANVLLVLNIGPAAGTAQSKWLRISSLPPVDDHLFWTFAK